MLRIPRRLEGLQRGRRFLGALQELEEMSGGYQRVESTVEQNTEEEKFSLIIIEYLE